MTKLDIFYSPSYHLNLYDFLSSEESRYFKEGFYCFYAYNESQFGPKQHRTFIKISKNQNKIRMSTSVFHRGKKVTDV